MSSKRKSSKKQLRQPTTEVVAGSSSRTQTREVEFTQTMLTWLEGYRRKNLDAVRGTEGGKRALPTKVEVQAFIDLGNAERDVRKAQMAAIAKLPVMEPITINTDSGEESKTPPGVPIQADEPEEDWEPAVEPNASASASEQATVDAIRDISVTSPAEEDRTTVTAAGTEGRPLPTSEDEHEAPASKSKRKVCQPGFFMVADVKRLVERLESSDGTISNGNNRGNVADITRRGEVCDDKHGDNGGGNDSVLPDSNKRLVPGEDTVRLEEDLARLPVMEGSSSVLPLNNPVPPVKTPAIEKQKLQEEFQAVDQ